MLPPDLACMAIFRRASADMRTLKEQEMPHVMKLAGRSGEVQGDRASDTQGCEQSCRNSLLEVMGIFCPGSLLLYGLLLWCVISVIRISAAAGLDPVF